MIGTFLFLLASLSGAYSVTGQDPDDPVPYTGTVEISEEASGIYSAHWTLEHSGKQYLDHGTGLQSGKELSLIFKSDPSQADQYEGLQTYRIKGDVLEGPFVLIDGKATGNERLRKIK